MNRRLVGALTTVALFAAGAAFAAPSPVQIALVDPAQLVKHDQSVGLLRIDLIYGKNAGMTGLELGLINHTTGEQTGFTYGVASYVQGAFTGWQDNAINIADKSFLGVQSGVFNQSKDGHGVQFGWINVTDRMSGLQLGLVNYTRVMTKGVQIGVGNIIKEGGIPFLPIVNARF
jgi:hypothetical protein